MMAAQRRQAVRRVLVSCVWALAAVGTLAGVGASRALAQGAPGWAIQSLSQPTVLTPVENKACEGYGPCDSYSVTVTNVGSAPSSGPVTIRDTLPKKGLVVFNVIAHELEHGSRQECTSTPIQCVYQGSVAPGDSIQVVIRVIVPPGLPEPAALNRAEVEGGGAPTVATSEPSTLTNAIDAEVPTGFGVRLFGMSAFGPEGVEDSQAGAHPDSLTTSVDFATVVKPEEEGNDEKAYIPVQNPKTLTVELPPGLIGDPQATPKCTEAQLEESLESHGGCPADSRIGTVVVNGEGWDAMSRIGGVASSIYNMVAEAGYPAEFGFRYAVADVLMYARVAPTAAGYRVLITVPDIAHALPGPQVDGVSFTFFGDPAARDGETASPVAFLRNPTNCSGSRESLESRLEGGSWVNPGAPPVVAHVSVYPKISGCEQLQFNPSIEVTPTVTEADSPSGYEIDLKLPQATNAAPLLATPDLKDARVTLPAGVSLSSAAAAGLEDCSASQIDLLGTETAADGLEHASAGHCPPGSQAGTVEVVTPLLEKPLTGHLYVAQPQCGGKGQPACTEASASNGELFGLYLEAAGSGVIVKLQGSVSANPLTGQLTTTFRENPQLPFSELKLKLDEGPRAPLANPQSCGTFTTTSDLTPWSAPVTPDATPSSVFAIGGCASPMPFAPSFSAGTVTPKAAVSSPFTLTLARTDGQQDLSGISTTLPPGLVGMLAQVPLCGEAQASAGTCPEVSRIGSTTVAAGAGSDPLWLSGSVYLTGPYNGAPFGLSVVVPAKAGPFNLGNVVVRAAIDIDPTTAAVTVTSGALPQIRDGVPFRLKTVNVTIDRPGFMLNPSNCDTQSIDATIAAAQDATASVSSPFAVGGCENLSFKPSFAASTQARASKADGASLDVKVSYPTDGEANIRSVKVDLPKQLPSRLTTLQKACPAAVFEANPAKCSPERRRLSCR